MTQWEQLKTTLPEESKDAILFVRLGDFYEMFFEDAEVGSRILNLTLTKRQETPMAGFPFHATEVYISKLIAAGKTVAIVGSEIENKPPFATTRKITQIIRPI